MLSAIIAALVFVSYSLGMQQVAQAQEVNCSNPSSTYEINECAGRAYKEADRKLNEVYRQLRSLVKGAERQELVNAQQSWIGFRDKNCDFATYRSRGGTGHSGFLSECLMRVTGQRTAELQQYIQDIQNQ
jgi:uncharacterized protein YecT (DUF1311 family)